MQFSNLLLVQYSLLVPVVAALFAAIIPYRNLRDPLMVLISLALPFFVFKIYQSVISGAAGLEWKLFAIIPGVFLHFKVEPLGLIFAIIIAVLWVVGLVYAIGYMRANNKENLRQFFAFCCISIFASLGLAFSSNLLTAFIFYELITLVTYPLVTHNQGVRSMKAGRVYLSGLLIPSTLFLLPAIILTFNAARNVDFKVGGILSEKISPDMAMIIFALYVLGTAKAAIIPFHKWLNAAMIAPSPVSAILHSVAVVNAGIFMIIKVAVYIFGISNLANITLQLGKYGDWLLYFSMFTVITASIIALTRNNFKELLAYSTISQLSYSVMALAMFSPKGLIAAILQMVAHSMAKITMFFVQGAVYSFSGKKKISELCGMGRVMPITFVAFSVAVISIIGLPPTVGFLAKLDILEGAMGAEHFLVVAVIAIGTILNAAYFLPIIYKAFFEKEHAASELIISKERRVEQFMMCVATSLVAIIILLLFVFSDRLIALAGMVGK